MDEPLVASLARAAAKQIASTHLANNILWCQYERGTSTGNPYGEIHVSLNVGPPPGKYMFGGPGNVFVTGLGPGIGLGKLAHVWAKPRYGRKSVRFGSPDLPPGRIFMKRTRGIRFLGSRGSGEPNWVILGWGGGGPMYAIVYPELGYIDTQCGIP